MSNGKKIYEITDTATSFAADDYIAVAGETNGTRKILRTAVDVRAHNDDATAHGKKYLKNEFVPFLGQGNWQTVAAGYTAVQQFATPYAYIGVRLVIANFEAVEQTIDLLKVAPVPSDLILGNDAALSGKWVSVTFSGLASATVPAAIGNVPGLLFSDIVPISSVARTDGGVNFLTQTRVYAADNNKLLVLTSGASGSIATIRSIAGLELGSNMFPGDSVTTPGGNGPIATGHFWPVTGLDYIRLSTQGLVAKVGDSISVGTGSTGNCCSDSVLNYSHGIGVLNFSRASQLFSVSASIGKSVVDTYHPTALRFFAWSPNDGWTTDSAFNDSFALALDLIDYCLRRGVVPIVCTSTPVGAIADNVTYLSRWISHNQKVRALNGVIVLDLASVTASENGDWIDGLGAVDRVHPSDAGYAVIAEAEREVILKYWA